MAGAWEVRLSRAAEADLQNVYGWTADRFGDAQTAIYSRIVSGALAALADGPRTPGARRRDDVGAGLFTMHASGRGRRARHLFLFRLGRHDGDRIVEVPRVLHDSMDLPRHVPPMDEG
ncbi:MAG: type II toxin-antitoxin system RelE/ParE family toxin [Rhodospirillales bacterium]|nr:MAG: type II toxin-antitoxin system RelE/ParE family toxin [Rhodospirillales bacterium]